MESQSGTAFAPGRLGALELEDRILEAATFEGMSPNGVPGARLTRFHREVAEGGVAMTTIAHCSTEADGRTSEQTPYLHEGIESELRALVSAVQVTGARVSGQMTQCGSFSKNRSPQRLARPLGLIDEPGDIRCVLNDG